MNLTTDIKNLNMAIIKKLFSLNKDCLIKEHPSPLQIQIISYLVENKDKDIYQKDLEKELNVSKAAISSVIKTMEKKGIIERIPFLNDARKNKIVLSDESIKFHQKKTEEIKALNQELISGISEEELINFRKTLNKMYLNLKKEDK